MWVILWSILGPLLKPIMEIFANVFKDLLKTPAETAVKQPSAALSTDDVPSNADDLINQHKWLLDRDKN